MNIIIVEYQLPARVTALVHDNADGSYTILVNSNKPRDKQVAGVLHELSHIAGGDFDTDRQADVLEAIMHGRDLTGIDLSGFNFYYREG